MKLTHYRHSPLAYTGQQLAEAATLAQALNARRFCLTIPPVKACPTICRHPDHGCAA